MKLTFSSSMAQFYKTGLYPYYIRSNKKHTEAVEMRFIRAIVGHKINYTRNQKEEN
jgi:hypothetical protein